MHRIPLLLALLLPTLPVAAQEDPRDIADIIEFRHWAHANPELSNQEFETSRRIAEYLRGLGLEVHTEIAITGVVGILDTGRPGPVVAMRADMDALPVEDRTGLPFASTKTAEYLGNEVPVAHACGHDIHMSVALGTAKRLVAVRDELRGKVMFIFQPAEEGTPPGEEGGAKLMLDEGVFDIARPQAIFALHSQPDLAIGDVGFIGGPAYAASDQFVIRLKGRQAHGALPHLAIDPVVMAAEVIQALQTIRSRNLDPQAAGVVTVGVVNAGQRYNIIPETAELQGTVRTYDGEVQDMIERRMHEILAGITGAHGGEYSMEYKRTAPATVNHFGLTDWAREQLRPALGEEHVKYFPPVMAAEDFAYFANEVPGFYFWLGVTPEGKENSALHTPTMRAEDEAIPVGIEAMTALLTRFLEAPPEL